MAEFKLKELKNEYPLDLDAIVKVSIDVRDLKDGIKIIESLQKEFGFTSK